MFTHLQLFDPVEFKNVDTPKGRFYFPPNGGKYPSITTVLGDGSKPFLEEWRQRIGLETADREAKRCAARGEAVHLMVEKFLKNEDEPTNDQRIEHITEFKRLRPCLNQIDNIVCQEIPLYSDELKIAGRVDIIADYKGRRSIIDIKTSNRDKHSANIEDYYLQTTAYALMLEEMHGIRVDDIVIIMSVEKGTVPLVFKKKVEDYIEPLVQRIAAYHSKHPIK